MTHPIRPPNKEIYALPIPIGIRHVRYQLQLLLPHYEVVYPLGRDYVLRTIALKELVNC